MSTLQILASCKNTYANYSAKGREVNPYDATILNTIIQIYNTIIEIDHEEVMWLWVTYLETGNLLFNEAIQKGRNRLNTVSAS